MECRKACTRRIFIVLCAGVLSGAIVAAGTPQVSPGGQAKPSLVPAKGSDPSEAALTFQTRLHPRSVAWWPFLSGPHYGDVEWRGADLPSDVLLTHVGSFRVGQGLNLPAELTGNLAGIAAGRFQYFLLQMRESAVDPLWRETLASMGATAVAETPVNGAVVRADLAAFQALSGSPLVQFIEPYHPAYKIHPSVGRVAQLTPEEAASPLFRLTVTLWPAEPLGPTSEILQQLGATIVGSSGSPEYGEALEVTVHAAAIPEIAKLEPVVLITEVAPRVPLGYYGAVFMQSPTATIGDYPYWKAGIDGDGQVVAAIDDGLSVDSYDFADTAAASGWVADGTGGACMTLASYAGCSNPANGRDPSAPNCHRKIVCYRPALNGSGNPVGNYRACDSNYGAANPVPTHGQLVMSVMAGNPTRGRVPAPIDPSPTDAILADDPNSFHARAFGPGYFRDSDQNGEFSEFVDTGLDGIAKGARIVFFDADQTTDCSGYTNFDYLRTFNEARQVHGASVMNLSLGAEVPDFNPIYADYGRALDVGHNSNPILVVTQAAGNAGSTGNEGKNISGATLVDQASCKNCIVAGGSSGIGGMYFFSAEGPAYLGTPKNLSRIAPTLLAEADFEYGCRSTDAAEDQGGPATCGQILGAGTSFAAPNIGGAAAVVREYFQQGFYNNKPTRAISSRLVRAILVAGATPIVGGKTFIPPERFNNVWGYGQVQLTRSLPLPDYPQTVDGLIVHDLPGIDLDGDGTTEPGLSDLSLPGSINGNQTLAADFTVNGVSDDLVVVLAWDDALGAASETGVLNDDLDLVVRYCGADGVCPNGDDLTFTGNAFSEDPEHDGTKNAELLPAGRAGTRPDGWWYTPPDSWITANGGTVAQWRDRGNNTEAVFVASYLNRPDEDLNGTADFQGLCDNADPNCAGGSALTGRWQVQVSTTNDAGVSARPFVVAIAGPVVAGSSVRFSNNPVTCNGETYVTVDEKAAGGADNDTSCVSASNCPVGVITARTTVEVLDGGGAVRDAESGLAFDAPPGGSLRFRTADPLPVSTDPGAAGPNGVLWVQDGWQLRVRYDDFNGVSTVVRESQAAVDCQALIEVSRLSQLGRDTFFSLDGGCDDDRYLDAGESFGLTFRFFNAEPTELPDAEVTLKIVDAASCPPDASDPCRAGCAAASYVRVDNPVQKIGLLPPFTAQQSTFGVTVTGTPPGRSRLEFVLGIKSAKAGQGIDNCKAFRNIEAFELLAQADDETRHFTTDCQTGCTLNYDRNGDEKLENRIAPNPFDPLDFAHRGRDETSISYLSLTTATRTPSCTNCAANGSLGGPWDFDTNPEGFRSGVTQTSKLSATDSDGCSNWGEDLNWNGVLETGEDQGDGTPGVLDQNWGTAGGCGYMTGTGIWHTGRIGTPTGTGAACRPENSICEQYDTNNGTLGEDLWFELLRTPAIHPISLGPDGTDGYAWKTQIVDWAWNMQYDAVRYGAWSWEFDLDTADNEANTLGDDWISFIWRNPYGVLAGGQLNILGGGHVFAPTDVVDGSTTEGDGKNGMEGNSRAGVRGCYFNDLNLIDLDGSGAGVQTAAFRPTANPSPSDDDCDNDYTLGPDSCPGLCGVDDDLNGVIDDALEICPCFECITGSPNAGKPCISNMQCNTSNTTNYACVSATDPSGVPTAYGDDVCGDGQTDETLAATFGANATLRQDRNFRIVRIADGGRQAGDISWNMLEDFYGPAGDTWQAEIGFIAYEAAATPFPAASYGMAIDDMVIEWQEAHPIAQAGNRCSTATNPDFAGQCASIALGTFFVTDADGAIPVTIIDPVPDGNRVNCDGDPALEVEVEAYSASERIPEAFCLDPVGSSTTEYRGLVYTTSRAPRTGDGRVYLSYNAAISPTVVVRYFDRNDGRNIVSNGPDAKPGVAHFDDDGDGTVDDADELCPQVTTLAPGRSPHLPGTPVRYSDDSCGCVDNPVAGTVTAFFDYADIRVVNVFLRDGGTSGAGTGDGDGFADPNETVVVDVVLRNGANYPLEDVTLTLQSNSPYIRDIRDPSITIKRLEKNGGGTAGAFDTCDTRRGRTQNDEVLSTCPSNDHFTFTVVAPADLNRSSLAEELLSSFVVGVQALGKAGAGSDLPLDVPILGTSIEQGFRVVHNLDRPGGVTSNGFVVETFEGFVRDRQYPGDPACGPGQCLLNYFRPFNSGDSSAELDGNRCQVNDPSNPNGNNTSPADFCQLGEGFSNTENHWHLRGPGAAGSGVCEDLACPDGGRSSLVLNATGKKCLSSTNIKEGDTTPILGDRQTEDYNRMTWVEWHRAGTASGAGNTFQLGFPDPGATVASPRDQAHYTGPELTFWTQLSILDGRMFGEGSQDPGDWTFSAARVYLCVDHDGDGQCDTKETGDLDGSERWEPLKAWYTPESSYRINNWINCMYDPTDDGNTEDQFFPNSVTTGPSSTCLPNAVDSCLGRTLNDTPTADVAVVLGGACFPETGVEGQEGVLGYAGAGGPYISWSQAKWVLKRYRLDEWAGRKVLFRWHMTPGGLPGVDRCAELGPGCGNRDDGWFVDDIRVNGLASDLTLLVDNAGESSPPPTPPICSAGEIKPALAAIRYPTFNADANRSFPASACSLVTETGLCDFDGDGTLDTGSDVAASDAPLRPFQLTGIKTPSATCVGGTLEYRFRDGFGQTLNDWSATPQTNSGSLIVTPDVTTLYYLDVRCKVGATTCEQTDSLRIEVPALGLVLRFADPDTLSWAGAGTFDTAKGDVTTLRNASGNFSGASCLENDGTDTTSTDTAKPAAGASFYYLVRLDGGTWNDGGPGLWASRDTTLNACE